MNAPFTPSALDLAGKLAPFDLSAAHMQAHRWVDVARPLIVAYLAIDKIHGDLIAGSHDAGPYDYLLECSADRMGKAQDKRRADIEGIRDAVLVDLSPPAPNFGRHLNECSPEVIDYDDLCEVWAERCADVLTVDAAIDREAGK